MYCSFFSLVNSKLVDTAVTKKVLTFPYCIIIDRLGFFSGGKVGGPGGKQGVNQVFKEVGGSPRV